MVEIMIFSVEKQGGSKEIQIFASDEYVVETVFYHTDAKGLLRLRALIDETLKQYNRK